MINNAIDELYKLYGFVKDRDEGFCSVYVYDQGYFNNAEIYVYDESCTEELRNIKQDYERSGYYVSQKQEKNIEVFANELFKGFFRISETNQRINYEYDSFCKRQSKKLGSEYTYQVSSYSVDGEVQGGRLLDVLIDMMNYEKACLIILEAPAGFGKTCTSYEIAHRIAEEETERIPMLAELSKDRTARIFKHVLLSEIDRRFTRLSSELVLTQIIKGRIPLIVDGFDELLLNSNSSNDFEKEEDSSSMLDTIAELFQSGSIAKVLITSRKTAMFAGEDFEEWIIDKLGENRVMRIQILPPKMEEWLSKEKREVLNEKKVNIERVSNPVLFSMLNSISLSEFEKKINTPGDILDEYLMILFNREKDRQQLLISVDEQKKIMRQLAAMMVMLDISCDEKEGIKALIEEIIEEDIPKYLDEYGQCGELIPTEEEFVIKLLNSAMLDRIKIESDLIGFVNDFVFGFFIGEAIICDNISMQDVGEKYLTKAIESMSAYWNKGKLFNIIDESGICLSTEQKVLIETKLVNRLEYDHVDEYISDIVFDEQINLDTNKYFYNCIFSNCVFVNCSVKTILFEGCQFINCGFYDLNIIEVEGVQEESVFITCKGEDSLRDAIHRCLNKSFSASEVDEEKDYERIVLEQFWMIGSERAEMRKSFRTLYKGIEQKQRKKVGMAIDRLEKKDIIKKLTYCFELNTMKMNEIKLILGRQDGEG
ncbi:MAG: hypothetical protein IJP92_05085 [Lachnospiraceae bacterium]|nr:hypothetical protein [Lachnospiraceae bacterium]